MSGRVLIVDDDQGMCEMLAVDLQRRGFVVAWHTAAGPAFTALQSEDFDVALVDLNLPGMSGIELCERVVANRADVPVVVMTAFGSMESAIAAIRAGAYDFIAKPFELDVLVLILERAVKHRALQDRVQRLSAAVKQSQRFDELIGDSSPMRELFAQLTRIADTESAVLITGESGTGKELVAHALHRRSRRRDGPFVALNCSALPEALLESELFGYKRGAFTDAKSDRKGLFLQANAGTLFLDEIGELPLPLQPKLLRALEERRLRPLGGEAEQSFDARILAATNRDLETAVDEGRFREDLFYRLNVITVEAPPLRARGTDILLLAENFIQHFAARSGKRVLGLSKQAAEKLLSYAWPGNVRELRNAIEHAVALTPYEKIAVEDLPKNIRAYHSSHVLIGSDNPTELVSLEEVERRYILHVLQSVGGNQTHAARILGLNRKTLYRKLQQYGVD
ncbi:MAG: Regulatory protein AtoC [bacterium]|nr:Regulatory protein AtoC [bacterium]